jgi:hypothetical protein
VRSSDVWTVRPSDRQHARRRSLEVTTGLTVYVALAALHVVIEEGDRAGAHERVGAVEFLPLQILGALALGFAIARWWAVPLSLASVPLLFAVGELGGAGEQFLVDVALLALLLHVLPAGLGVMLRREASQPG